MPVIERFDIPEKIRRAFNIRDRGVGETISPEIVPVVIAEDLSGQSLGQDWPREAHGGARQTASAATRSVVAVINPAGSQLDLIVHGIWVRRFDSGLVKIAAVDGPSGYTDDARAYADLRIRSGDPTTGTFPEPTGRVGHQLKAAGDGQELLEVYSNFSNLTLFPLSFTLPPDTAVCMYPASDNVGIEGVWTWSERLRVI